MNQFLDVVVAVFLVAGCGLSLLAGIGLLTFPDVLTRMHAATKPQVLGLLLIFMALAIHQRSWVIVPVLVLAWGLQLLTAPVSAHMLGRAGYRTKHAGTHTLYSDELRKVLDELGSEAPQNQSPETKDEEQGRK